MISVGMSTQRMREVSTMVMPFVLRYGRPENAWAHTEQHE
jgi:hypothetical protein